jgi:hypothetical protein
MDNFKRKENINDIFKKYSETSLAVVLALMIITAGLYIINWLFLRNREFELMDEDAPDSKRGLALMVFLPFGWGLIMFVSKALLFTGEPLLLGIMEIVIWGLIIFLLVNYVFDFCLSYSKITKSNAMIWFSMFLIGFIGIISTSIQFYYLSPLVFFAVITVVAMQAELSGINKQKRKKYGRRESSILSVH